ncbi:MAG: hypothetical protein ABIO70_28890 [Pseudomonadota bacterium]
MTSVPVSDGDGGGALDHYPTIVLGFGAYGARVLRRLLRSTALRGVLVWEDVHGGASPADRRLKDLRLLWVPAGDSAALGAEGGASEQDSVALFQDIYRLIKRVPATTTEPQVLERELNQAARELTSAVSGKRPLGLDVIVLAHPETRQMVGALNALLPSAMNRLATFPNLRPTSATNHRLNFVQVVDFENYHSPEASGQDLRRAFHTYLTHWEGCYAQSKPGSIGFARTYLVDGHPEGRVCTLDQRIDEVSLFLEFLIFEGLRANKEMKALWQRLQEGETTLGTFGIRMLERSEGLTRRLAAAWFGARWLHYLAGDAEAAHPPGDNPADLQTREGFRARIEKVRPAQMGQARLAEQAESMVREAIEQLELAMGGISIEGEDWAQAVMDQARAGIHAFQRRLGDWEHQELASLAQSQLTPVRRDLEKEIDKALTARNPLPIGVVIAEVEGVWKDILDEKPQPAERREGLRAWKAELDALQRRFVEFRGAHTRPNLLKGWWLPMAALLAAGITPLLSGFLLEVPEPASTHGLLVRLHRLLQVVAAPAWLGLILLALFWVLGFLVPQRKVTYVYKRALEFWRHPTRGRFAGQLRRALGPGGVIRSTMDRLVHGTLEDVDATMRSELRKELVRMLDRLKARRAEACWLENQLGSFLKNYGLDAATTPEGLKEMPDRGNAVWSPTHQVEDLKLVMAQNPLEAVVFQERQASLRVLHAWNEEYCASFLYPIDFMETLAGALVVPASSAGGGAKPAPSLVAGPAVAFVKDKGKFAVAFHLDKAQGVTTIQQRAVIPKGSDLISGLDAPLNDQGFMGDDRVEGRDPERLYLLRLQQNISLDRLKGEP